MGAETGVAAPVPADFDGREQTHGEAGDNATPDTGALGVERRSRARRPRRRESVVVAVCYVLAINARQHPWRTVAVWAIGGIFFPPGFADTFGWAFIVAHLVALGVAHRDGWPGLGSVANRPRYRRRARRRAGRVHGGSDAAAGDAQEVDEW